MCGRFGIQYDLETLASYFEFDPASVRESYSVNLNIAPTTDVIVVRNSTLPDLPRQATYMRWGLIPHWARADAPRSRPMFNARAETIGERPAFRATFARQRCLIPASGFYEWTDDDSGGRIPMWIHPHASDEPLGFAGIWSQWNGPDGLVESCSIITTAANDMMSPIHHRMPVILERDTIGAWLATDTDKSILQHLIQPREWSDMVYEPADPSLLKRKSRSEPAAREPAPQSNLM